MTWEKELKKGRLNSMDINDLTACISILNNVRAGDIKPSTNRALMKVQALITGEIKMTWKDEIIKNKRITFTNTTQDRSDYYTDEYTAEKFQRLMRSPKSKMLKALDDFEKATMEAFKIAKNEYPDSTALKEGAREQKRNILKLKSLLRQDSLEDMDESNMIFVLTKNTFSME